MTRQKILLEMAIIVSICFNLLIPHIGPIAPLMGLSLAMIIYSNKNAPVKISNIAAASLCLNLFLIFVSILLSILNFCARFI